ncbi:MAG: type II toxin-antitoxin system VapC family toxin [Planctomycetota bacterium]
MKVLVDTHIWLWWLEGSPKLGASARRLLSDGANELLWSAASTWELAIKLQLGKLRLGQGLDEFLLRMFGSYGLTPLPVHHAHASRVATLPLIHRDPFDRLLVAQSAVEGVPLLTADPLLRQYGIECLDP